MGWNPRVPTLPLAGGRLTDGRRESDRETSERRPGNGWCDGWNSGCGGQISGQRNGDYPALDPSVHLSPSTSFTSHSVLHGTIIRTGISSHVHTRHTRVAELPEGLKSAEVDRPKGM